jgi:ubiquitin-activating enzyme E1-like protein
MTALQPTFVAGSSGGLENDIKPFLITDQSFQILENAYAWRERVKKRQGLRTLGRLRRSFTMASLGTSGASPWTFNIYTTLTSPITAEPNASIESGSVTIVVGAVTFTDFSKTGSITAATQANPCQITSAGHLLTTGDVITINGVVGMTELNGNTYQITVVDANNFTLNNTDSTLYTAYVSGGTWSTTTAQGNGNLVSTTPGNSGTINYLTGNVILTYTGGAQATTITFGYFPSLPVMGIYQRDVTNVDDQQTIFFDTKYAYIYVNGDFTEFVPGFTWDGGNADFFQCTNYNNVTTATRYFFITNNVNLTVPMRYYDGSTLQTFTPGISGTTPSNPANNFLLQALILIPYYGHLLALNCTTGPAIGSGNSINFFNRCYFSKFSADPTVTNNWRIDIPGNGGFIDAPTNEAIVSATFYKNTLIVGFERSTWQLRYVGQYGLPFLWERISSDFGCEATNSTVIFDDGILTVGDKAITSSNGISVNRIDTKIPDFVFNIRNANNAINRVVGVRDYEEELVYWTLVNSNYQSTFPNQVLVYNYRNNTFATFRDNVTFFGTFQPPLDVVLWGDFTIFWNNMEIFWQDAKSQSEFPFIVAGNQQGFINYYMVNTMDDPSLAITAINVGVTPVQMTVPNHNLQQGEIIYITGITFSGSTDLNNQFFQVSIIDANTIALLQWNGTFYAVVTSASTGTYLGNGVLALIPQMYVQTKDFNPYQQQGKQLKLSYIDFLMDATPSAAMNVQLFINSIPGGTPSASGNFIVGNTTMETSLTQPYYPPSSQYAWHRFYATLVGQYINIVLTYNDDQMNTLATHQQSWEMNAYTLWHKPGGKILF